LARHVAPERRPQARAAGSGRSARGRAAAPLTPLRRTAPLPTSRRTTSLIARRRTAPLAARRRTASLAARRWTAPLAARRRTASLIASRRTAPLSASRRTATLTALRREALSRTLPTLPRPWRRRTPVRQRRPRLPPRPLAFRRSFPPRTPAIGPALRPRRM